MKKLLLCITIILCVCTYGWTAGVPFTGSIDAEDVDYPNTKSISGNPTNVKTAIDGLKTEIVNISAGTLTDIDDLPGDTVDDDKIDSSLINNATSTGLGVASFPNTTFTVSTAGAVSIKANVFQPYSATLADFSEGSPIGTYDLSDATITFGLDASDIPDISGTYATAGHDHSGTYEPADATIMKTGSYANLTAINAVSPSSGYLRYNGSAFVYDTPSGTEHDAVTLGVDADTILGLSTQQITLDTQTANYVFAGPATGEAADPTFRALVADDIPDLSGIYQAADTELAAIAALANGSGVLTNDGAGNMSWGAGGGSMVYPSTGIPVSTGSAWGTSITDNSANWNTAYGWGNHASAGYQASDSSLTNIASNWTVDSSGNVSGIGTIEPTPTAHPQAVLYDSNAPGSTTAEKAMAYLWAEYVDGADNAENSSAGIAARAAGAWADWIKYLAGAVYIYHDLDVDGDVTGKSFSATQSASQAGQWFGSELSGNGTDYQAWEVADEITTSLILKFPNANPLANSIQIFGAPSEGKSTFAWLQITGNSKYFGTDGSGTVGIHDLPAASSGLPEGGTAGQIIVKTESGAEWQDFEDQPAYTTLLNAFLAAGLNTFTFTPYNPASYPYYSATGTFNLDFEVTDTSTSYTIAGVRYQLDEGGYGGNSASDQGSNIWRVALADLTEDTYTLQLEATDSKGTPNTGESSEYTVIVDTTDPVINLSAGSNPTTHDGSGTDTWDLQIGMIEELHTALIQYRLTVDGGETPDWSTWASPWTTTGIPLPEETEYLHIAVKVTDLAGNWDTGGITVAYSGGGTACSGVKGNNATTDAEYITYGIPSVILKKITIDCGGTPSSINARTTNTFDSSTEIAFCVYADDNGSPGSRLWYGSPMYHSGSEDKTQTLSDTSINYNFSAGDYWIGIVTKAPGRLYGSSTTGGTVYRYMSGTTFTFPTPPASLGEPDETLAYDLSGWLVF